MPIRLVIGGALVRKLIVSIVMLSCLIGCSDDVESIDPTQPVITDVSSYAVVIGETIEFYGQNFKRLI